MLSGLHAGCNRHAIMVMTTYDFRACFDMYTSSCREKQATLDRELMENVVLIGKAHQN